MRLLFEVPLHITSIWLPIKRDDPLDTGSIGCGIVVRPGLKVEAWEGVCRHEIEHVRRVFERLGVRDICLSFIYTAEPGYGYGVSAAWALAAAYAAHVFRKIDLLKAADMAHMVEVELGTGYGDVIAEFYGKGIELRLRPGSPSRGLVVKIEHPSDVAAITAPLRKVATYEMHKALGNRLFEVAPKWLNRVIRDPSYEAFCEASMGFSREMGFLNRHIEELLRPIWDLLDTAYVKKGVLVILTKVKHVREIVGYLLDRKVKPRVFRLCEEGLLGLAKAYFN